MTFERLQKVLAHAGVGSRRAIEGLIEAGRITVNGKVATLGDKVDASKDQVEVDGSRVPLGVDLVHYLLNKPPGVVVTASDPEGRPTVLDLIPEGPRVWPAGRLDIDTEGLLVVTNDGDLSYRLTHPSFEIPKTYVAEVAGNVSERTARLLARGVELDDGPTAPARVVVTGRGQGASLVELTIHEGRNRQVRRMFEAVDHRVLRLVRTELGPLKLGRLKPGSLRKLGPQEVAVLYRAVGL
jgi:23S rRNA pseudouridine2605 synthase